jgi:hypothetical protein
MPGRSRGEPGWRACLIYTISTAMLDSARRHVRIPTLARWLLGLVSAGTFAANVAHVLGRGPVGAAVGAWPAVAFLRLLWRISIYEGYSGRPVEVQADDC